MSDERTPLLLDSGEASGPNDDQTVDHHTQFCRLIGTRPLTLPQDSKHRPDPESLYHRATTQRSQQHIAYMFTSALTNTLIMSQIVLGAALTGLGASNASGVLVTIFGATNTIIAGAIAFLKSRGQPMRARMFRDDLERVVDEIENSAIMWLGISKNVHGYDAIDTDDQVTVRSEVARLTRLYDKAVKTNTLNDPDTYQFGGPSDPHAAALRDKSALQVGAAPPAPAPAPTSSAPDPASAPVAPQDVDASPATKPPEAPKPEDAPKPANAPKPADVPKPADAETPANDPSKPADPATSTDKGKEAADAPAQAAPPQSNSSAAPNTPSQPTPAPPPAPVDPDESPASAAHLEKHSQDTSKADEAAK